MLLAMLAAGRLHLTAIAKPAPHLTPANRDRILERAAWKSKRQIEELVAELSSRPDVASSIRKIPLPLRPVAAPEGSLQAHPSPRNVSDGRRGLCGAGTGPMKDIDELRPDGVAAGPGTEDGVSEETRGTRVDDAGALRVVPMGPTSGGRGCIGGDRFVETVVVDTFDAGQAVKSANELRRDGVAAGATGTEGDSEEQSKLRPGGPGVVSGVGYDADDTESRRPEPGGTVSMAPRERGSIEPLSPARYKVQFTASAALRDKLDRLQALMRSSVPDGDLAQIIEAAVTEKLERLEAQRFAKTKAPRKVVAHRRTKPSSRHIPAAVRRAVYDRDGGRCRFVDERGRRCTARSGLEFHHRHPFGYGGDTSPENICLMRPAHNQYVARHDYGSQTMARYRRRGDRVSEAT